MAEGGTARAAIAVALAWVAAALAYVLQRAGEVALFPSANPAALIYTAEDPFAWRVAIALYAGGMALFGGWALVRRRPLLAARLAWLGSLAATLAVVTQAALWP